MTVITVLSCPRPNKCRVCITTRLIHPQAREMPIFLWLSEQLRRRIFSGLRFVRLVHFCINASAFFSASVMQCVSKVLNHTVSQISGALTESLYCGFLRY